MVSGKWWPTFSRLSDDFVPLLVGQAVLDEALGERPEVRHLPVCLSNASLLRNTSG